MKWDDTETEAINISCEVCENGTDGPRDPRVCRKCEKVKVKPNVYLTDAWRVPYSIIVSLIWAVDVNIGVDHKQACSALLDRCTIRCGL